MMIMTMSSSSSTPTTPVKQQRSARRRRPSVSCACGVPFLAFAAIANYYPIAIPDVTAFQPRIGFGATRQILSGARDTGRPPCSPGAKAEATTDDRLQTLLLTAAAGGSSRSDTNNVLLLRMSSGMYSSADFDEVWAGGERYEMVPLPDRLVDTTIFVGNLCEFVHDGVLSELFHPVSTTTVSSPPACVARKPNASSKGYGFVTFPTVQEKEAAILRFSGYELNGRRIKVEPITDKPGCKRVRVPGKLVSYTLGESRFLRQVNSEVKSTGDETRAKSGRPRDPSTGRGARHRISREDVKRLSRGEPAKNKGYRSGSGKSVVQHKLGGKDRGAFERAARNGYVTLDGTGYRRGRKGSALANIHRQWCDARDVPHVILCKASGGRPLDNVIVDLSPLRLGALSTDMSIVNEFLIKWKADILVAAEHSGMTLIDEYVEDNSQTLDIFCVEEDGDGIQTELVITIDPDSWASQPLWNLPALSLGVFEGERSQAKAMAKELALLWKITEGDEDDGNHVTLRTETTDSDSSRTAKGKQNWNDRKQGKDIRGKRKGLRQHRGGRRRHRNDDEDMDW